MAKKNKFASDKPFSLEICNHLRFHVGERTVAENNRDNAFSDRDAALAEKAELTDKDSPEFKTACINHSDAVCRIDQLSTEIKWHNNKIGEIVANADKPQQLELSLEMPEEKPRKNKDQMEFGEGEKKVKPVGRPEPVKPEASDRSMGDGHNEHLKVSTQELDLPEKLIGRLIKGGYDTVGKANDIILKIGYDNPQNEAYQDAFDVSAGDAEKIVTAVREYVKMHAKAELQQIREEETGPTAGGLKLEGAAAGTRVGRGAGRKKAS